MRDSGVVRDNPNGSVVIDPIDPLPAPIFLPPPQQTLRDTAPANVDSSSLLRGDRSFQDTGGRCALTDTEPGGITDLESGHAADEEAGDDWQIATPSRKRKKRKSESPLKVQSDGGMPATPTDQPRKSQRKKTKEKDVQSDDGAAKLKAKRGRGDPLLKIETYQCSSRATTPVFVARLSMGQSGLTVRSAIRGTMLTV